MFINKNFFRLWLAQIISQFGDRIHQLALIGLVAERAFGSTAQLSHLMAFTILPVFIIQPFAGALIDRWDRKTTLFICDFIRAGLVLTIPFIFIYRESMVPVYVIVFLTFCFSRFYVPAKMSIIPDLVSKDNLLKANSLVSITGMIAFILGAAIGAFLVEFYGARNGFIIDGFTFLLSAVLLIGIKRTRSPMGTGCGEPVPIGDLVRSTHFWQETKEGFVYVYTHPQIRFVMNMLFTLLFAAGAIYVVLIVFVQTSFGSVTKDLGILAIALGAGAAAGALSYGHYGANISWERVIFNCLLAAAIMLIIFAVAVKLWTSLWLGIIVSFFLGVVIGPIFIAANTAAQVFSDEAMRGKVFSAIEIVIHAGFLSAMLLSSWLSQIIGEFWILITTAVFIMIVAVLGQISLNSKTKLASSG